MGHGPQPLGKRSPSRPLATAVLLVWAGPGEKRAGGRWEGPAPAGPALQPPAHLRGLVPHPTAREEAAEGEEAGAEGSRIQFSPIQLHWWPTGGQPWRPSSGGGARRPTARAPQKGLDQDGTTSFRLGGRRAGFRASPGQTHALQFLTLRPQPGPDRRAAMCPRTRPRVLKEAPSSWVPGDAGEGWGGGGPGSTRGRVGPACPSGQHR